MDAPIIYRDKDITEFTTFGLPVKAKLFAEYDHVRQLTWLSRQPEFLENEVLHIGGGSNLLFLSDFNGLVLHSKIKGILKYKKDNDTVFVIAGAGEKWTDLVDWCVEQNLAGLENMTGIPGSVGASAVQNVGAYGVEAKDLIHSVECFDTVSREVVSFKNEECDFSYRDSRFKHDWKNRYVVLRVGFKLKESNIATNLNYGPLKELAAELGHKPTLMDVKNRVEGLRNSKLPKVDEEGSAGSFFKNPIVPRHFYDKVILRIAPEMPFYYVSDELVKIPAGWLIEKCGLKGKRVGGARVYPKQSLVISNFDHAAADDVASLANLVKRTVKNRFLIDLKPEVNYIDSDIKVEVLGSGTSKGVPEIGCDCDVCKSSDKKDKRRRASVYVQTHGMNFLIDASPDMRDQLLDSSIEFLDFVLLTHIHFDHIGGLEDFRSFCSTEAFPIYAKKDVIDDLHQRLGYCFSDHPYPGVPKFKMHEIGEKPFYINGLEIIPIEVLHGKKPIVGFRIGKFAYITDAKTISETEKLKLENLDVLIVNALRDREHFAHFTLSEALQLIEELKPKKAYLTHLCHEIGKHSDLIKRLPETVSPAYDGLKIKI